MARVYQTQLCRGVANTVSFPNERVKYRTKVEDATQVEIEGIDRENRYIAVRPTGGDWTVHLRDLLMTFNFKNNLSLEKVHTDFLTRRIKRTLKDIGNPPIQRDNSSVRQALGLQNARVQTRESNPPVSRVLWDASELAKKKSDVDIETAKPALKSAGIELNNSQWTALENALSRRLHLVWGPPGTGKSRTLRSIALGRILEGNRKNRDLNVLITAQTYNAMDNVLAPVFESYLDASLPNVTFYRLRSTHADAQKGLMEQIDTPVDRRNPSSRLKKLQNDLMSGDKVSVVGATPQQIHKLIRTWDEDSGTQEIFDHVLIDEASQLDVAESILALAAIREGGQLTVVGDPLQLAPIHKAEPPEDLESTVGSVYNYFKDSFSIPQDDLKVNYRSNKEIVGFQKSAGYSEDLKARNPDLSINLIPSDTSPSPALPNGYPGSDFVEEVLDPNRSCVCVTYSGGRSSQWNEFEANMVTSIIHALKESLGKELDGSGEVSNPITELHSIESFWDSGVGIVTPHKAQQASVVNKLQEYCGEEGEEELIRSAVNTVEKYQGDERDVIIASYAVSDVDVVKDEDEFLLGLNRFNVLQSRAKAKVIVIVSEDVIKYLSNDLETLKESKLLKRYANIYCNQNKQITTDSPSGASKNVQIRFSGDDPI